MKKFLATMDSLGEELGPLLFQSDYFNKKAFAMVPFLRKLPRGYRFAERGRAGSGWIRD